QVERREEPGAQPDHGLLTQRRPVGRAIGDGDELPLREHALVCEEVLLLHALGLAEIREAHDLQSLQSGRMLRTGRHDAGVRPGPAAPLSGHVVSAPSSYLRYGASLGRPVTAHSSRVRGRMTTAPQVPTWLGGTPTRHTASGSAVIACR